MHAMHVERSWSYGELSNRELELRGAEEQLKS
jgi:hypothetical protein